MSTSLEDIIGEIVFRQQDEDRRRANNRVEGTVKQVDAAKRRIKVDVGTPGQELMTPWIRTREMNGRFQTHFLPKAGEKVTVVSVDGEISEASVVEPGTYSDQKESPSDRADEGVIQTGKTRMTWREDRLHGRVGEGANAASFSAGNGVAKLRVGSAFIAVSGGRIVASSEVVVGADPNPDL
ncbi:phage baseplate assembly protein V [Phreatobacter stygius]|nr:phage baseplate assembly protein V [Phreatobacter stygius]